MTKHNSNDVVVGCLFVAALLLGIAGAAWYFGGFLWALVGFIGGVALLFLLVRANQPATDSSAYQMSESGGDEDWRSEKDDSSAVIRFACPSCHKRLRTKAESAGKRAKCPCGHVFRIRDGSDSSESEARDSCNQQAGARVDWQATSPTPTADLEPI